MNNLIKSVKCVMLFSLFFLNKSITAQEKPIQKMINNSFKLVCFKNSNITHTGSGFIISKKQGSNKNNVYFCITNEHVLDNSDSVIIVNTRFPEKTYFVKNIIASIHKLDASIFTFESSDLFEGVINTTNIKEVSFNIPEIGSNIFTVSSPKGLVNSVSSGIVSSFRTIKYKNLIQITAPISHGSSGGVVFDLKGIPFGLIVSQYNEGQNLNFCVSLSQIFKELTSKSICDKMLNFNSVPNNNIKDFEKYVILGDSILNSISIAFDNKKDDYANYIIENTDNDYLIERFLFLKCNNELQQNEFNLSLNNMLFALKKYNTLLSQLNLVNWLEIVNGFHFKDVNKDILINFEYSNDQFLDVYLQLYNGFINKRENNNSKTIFYLKNADELLNKKLTSSDSDKNGFIFLNNSTEHNRYKYISLAYFNLKDYYNAEEYGFKMVEDVFLLRQFTENEKKSLSEYYLTTAILSERFDKMKLIYKLYLKNLSYNWDTKLIYYIDKYCK